MAASTTASKREPLTQPHYQNNATHTSFKLVRPGPTEPGHTTRRS